MVVQGPFLLLESVRKGTAPPEGIAQKPTVQKWYSYLEGISQLVTITEGPVKVSKLQKDVNADPSMLIKPNKPSPILEAPPFTVESDLTGVWFTDASAVQKNRTWQYTAVALEIKTGRTEIEKGEGSAQIGELQAVLLAVKFGTQYIY